MDCYLKIRKDGTTHSISVKIVKSAASYEGDLKIWKDGAAQDVK